jgi:cytochrome P450
MSKETIRRPPFFGRADLFPFDHGKFAGLRADRALIKFTGSPMTWGVTRYVDVAALLRDTRIGHHMSAPMLEHEFGSGPTRDYFLNSIVNRDGVDHMRLRTMMSKSFSAPRVRELRAHASALVDQLLDDLVRRGTFDVVDDLAVPVPVALLCQLLDIDDIDIQEVQLRFDDSVSGDQGRSDPAVEWLRGFMDEILAGRRPDPDGGLLDRLLAAENHHELSHTEVLDNALALFFAGFETTTNLIAKGIDAFLDHRDQWDRLVEDPSLSTSAVEEILRFAGPLYIHRIALEPIEFGGRALPPNTLLMLLLAVANRDPDVFDEPDRFDIGRDPNPHLAFSFGAHHCLGSQLARLEGDIVFRKVAERMPVVARAGLAVREANAVRSLRHLPVTIG